jgi:hypothetical protein
MSMHFSRNLVIPVWFAVFALFTTVAPPFDLFYSVFLVIVGLAVPTIAFMLWHDPPVPVVVVPQHVDATRKSPLTHST